MKLDKKLNLVIKLDRDDGSAVHVYHTPILRATYESFHRVISKVVTQIYAENLSFFAGPSEAFLTLREVAQNTLRPDGSGNWWEGEGGVEDELIPEIKRLTNVLVAGEDGWKIVPFENAVKDGVFTEDEVAEVLGSVTFFTSCSNMMKNPIVERGLTAATAIHGWETTSSSLTEFKTSLTTSTLDETTPVKGKRLSIAS